MTTTLKDADLLNDYADTAVQCDAKQLRSADHRTAAKYLGTHTAALEAAARLAKTRLVHTGSAWALKVLVDARDPQQFASDCCVALRKVYTDPALATLVPDIKKVLIEKHYPLAARTR